MNNLIDHTLLAATASHAEITTLCNEAKTHAFFSVCINPTHVALSAKLLADSSVKVCTVIGFPLGANTTAVKVYETKDAIANGADEIDMVINIADALAQNWESIAQEITAIKQACGNTLLKVIFETCLLPHDTITKLCEISKQAQADFVKTSTGFSTAGATEAHIKLMRLAVGADIGVKASGGVRSQQIAQAMVAAGATRIGTSAGVSIMDNTVSTDGY